MNKKEQLISFTEIFKDSAGGFGVCFNEKGTNYIFSGQKEKIVESLIFVLNDKPEIFKVLLAGVMSTTVHNMRINEIKKANWYLKLMRAVVMQTEKIFSEIQN